MNPTVETFHDEDGNEFGMLTWRDGGTTKLVEVDAIRHLGQLRETDLEMYEFVWDLILLGLERGAPIEALEG